jgi:hypothetical protein
MISVIKNDRLSSAILPVCQFAIAQLCWGQSELTSHHSTMRDGWMDEWMDDL